MEAELQQSTEALATANSEAVGYRSRVSQLQALVEATERTRQEQEKGIRSHAASAQHAQCTVASLNSKISKHYKTIIIVCMNIEYDSFIYFFSSTEL